MASGVEGSSSDEEIIEQVLFSYRTKNQYPDGAKILQNFPCQNTVKCDRACDNRPCERKKSPIFSVFAVP